MFPQSFINEGHIEFDRNSGAGSVRIFESRYSNKNIVNVPAGLIKNAYWQGNTVHIVLEDGYHYVYDDFNHMVNSWRE